MALAWPRRRSAWTCTPTTPISEGDHTFEAVAEDQAGNTSTPDTVDFTVTGDTTPPPGDTTAPDAPVITTPAQGSSTTDTTPTVSGTAEPGSTVTVTEGGIAKRIEKRTVSAAAPVDVEAAKVEAQAVIAQAAVIDEVPVPKVPAKVANKKEGA